MPTQTEKLRAYTAHLLDEVIHLREKYALLEPMIFNKELTGDWSGGRRAHGFQTLRTALLYSCAQDVAKIAFDDDRRVPSLVNLIAPLEDADLRARLRDDYSVIKYHAEEGDDRDPAVQMALTRMEGRETRERAEQFDALYSGVQADWGNLKVSPALGAFAKIRDKITAHSEIRYGKEEYRRVDVGSLGLKWEDLRKVIDRIQALTDKLNLLIRASNFSWTALDEQLLKAAESFWDRTPDPSNAGE